MSDFNKDEYLNDLPDMDNLSGQTAPSGTGPAADDAAAGAPQSAAGHQSRHRLRVPPPLQTPKTPLPTTP